MANKTQMGVGAIIVVLVAAYFGIDLQQHASSERLNNSNAPTKISSTSQSQSTINSNSLNLPTQNDDEKIQQAFRDQKSNIQVQSSGRVIAVLRDDNKGSRHQKFILELSHGLTVLVAHNIDLSPRVDDLKKGDHVEFNGEYEYSHQGGVIHWTHHAPQKNHVDGWLKHNGRIYQ